jgi:LL-diaminopimelate aminotransferase
VASCFEESDTTLSKDFAERIKRLPPYLFAEIDRIVQEKKQAGVDIVSLGVGDPDLPPPKLILGALKDEASNPKNHGYSFSRGEREFRETVAWWMKDRFGVDVDPETEVAALIGSKEGLANIARAFINTGDHVLVPNPAYPVYANGSTLLNDGVPVSMPLLEQNGFLPDLKAISGSNVKMMFLNYPNNPTGAVADKDFLKEAVDFTSDNGAILCYDNAYSEVTYDDYRAPSILEIDGGMDTAIEFHSCSKTFNMTGDRIAFAVGNSRLIDGLLKVKTQIDSGPSKYIQHVAMRGLRSYVGGKRPADLEKANTIYQQRCRILVEGLRVAGLECKMPKATFYVWAKCGGDSMDFSRKLIDVGVVATPGVGFGEYGEGYLRFSVTLPTEDIKKACERITKVRT